PRGWAGGGDGREGRAGVIPAEDPRLARSRGATVRAMAPADGPACVRRVLGPAGGRLTDQRRSSVHDRDRVDVDLRMRVCPRHPDLEHRGGGPPPWTPKK